ncbi:MAG: hypothetical protein SFY92_12050 [Verrucomicrobiae bacterium]|nr:hypothetical protein [Verrucomicrobiae bacterium]
MTPEKMAEFQRLLEEQQKKGKLAPGVMIPGQTIKETPSDKYEGKDREELITLTKTTWEKKYPKDNILAIRIGMKDWERKTEKRWREATSSWYMVDYSQIQAMVIVKQDEQTAMIYPFNISKDHTDKDKISTDTTGRENPMMPRKIALSDLKL